MARKDPTKDSPVTLAWNRRQLFKAGSALGLAAGLSGTAAMQALPEEREAAPKKSSISSLEDRVQGVAGPGAEDFQRRIEAARKALKDRGLDALFIEATPSLPYFSGVSWWPSERVFGILIPKKGDVAYISPAFEEGRARERIRIGDDVRTWEENESPYQRVREALKDRGLGSGKLAVDPAARLFVFDGLRKAGAAGEIVEGSSIVNACRGRKTSKELALMRRANEITQAAIAHAVAGLEVGMTQGQLAQAVKDAHAAQGAGPGWALVLFGPNAAYPHGTDGAYTLKKGDLVLLDCGTDVHGYRSDITRTYCFGKAPSDRQRQVWDLVRKAQKTAFEKIRPGLPAGEIDRTARAVIEAGGFGGGYQTLTHRLGHGIGLEVHEWPYLVQDSPVKLAPGQTFSDEPGIYLVGELGVRIEDIVAVTEDGAEYLSTPVDEIEVVGI